MERGRDQAGSEGEGSSREWGEMDQAGSGGRWIKQGVRVKGEGLWGGGSSMERGRDQAKSEGGGIKQGVGGDGSSRGRGRDQAKSEGGGIKQGVGGDGSSRE